MCTLLITVSGGFLGGGWRPSIQNEYFLIRYTLILLSPNLGYCGSLLAEYNMHSIVSVRTSSVHGDGFGRCQKSYRMRAEHPHYGRGR